VDAGSALDGRCGRWTAKACGPDAPTLASSLADIREATVARKPGHRLFNAHIFSGCEARQRLIPCCLGSLRRWSYVDGGWAGTIWRSSPGKRGASLHAALVQRPSCCIRRLGGNRAQEVRFTRFLRNEKVGVEEMASHAASRTAARVAGRDIIVVQDSSELALGGRRARDNGMDLLARAAEYVGCYCMQRWRLMRQWCVGWVLLMRRCGIGTRAW